MEEIIYSQNINSTIFCYSMDFSGISKQNAHGGWNVVPRHLGVMFRPLRAFVDSMATLRYEPCTQFINVSQRALHIYFIDGCRRIKSKTKTATCEQAPRSLFLFWLCMARNSQFTRFRSASRWGLRHVLSGNYSSCWKVCCQRIRGTQITDWDVVLPELND